MFKILMSYYYTARKLVAQCIVIGPVCVCGGRAGGLAGSVCYHDNSKLRASIFTKLGL